MIQSTTNACVTCMATRYRQGVQCLHVFPFRPRWVQTSSCDQGALAHVDRAEMITWRSHNDLRFRRTFGSARAPPPPLFFKGTSLHCRSLALTLRYKAHTSLCTADLWECASLTLLLHAASSFLFATVFHCTASTHG